MCHRRHQWHSHDVGSFCIRSFLGQVGTQHAHTKRWAMAVGKTNCLCLLQAEVQTITTEGGADGSFTLAFGDLDYPLPGTVDVVNGEDFIVTSQDLTPYIKRGDRISALGWEYAVHAFRPFNATHLYLAKVTLCLYPRSNQVTMCKCNSFDRYLWGGM